MDLYHHTMLYQSRSSSESLFINYGCTGYDYFTSSLSQISGELVLGSQNNMPDETNGVNNAVSSYKEAVQFSASFVTSLFASF